MERWKRIDELAGWRELVRRRPEILRGALTPGRLASRTLPAGGGLSYSYAAMDADDGTIASLAAAATELGLVDQYRALASGEVMNVGDIHDKHTRVYETNLYLPYHSDPSDVVGLMCVRKAPAGGLSSLVSVAAIHNRLLAEHREHLGLYYRSWYFAHLCEPQPSLSPIFSHHQGKLSCRYLRQYIELGHELRGLPLSRVEVEALDLFDAVMLDPAMRVDMMLEPGDLQFANNYAVLHSRTRFEDHTDPDQRRRMLRLWLKMPNARTLAPEFPGRNGFPAPAKVASA